MTENPYEPVQPSQPGQPAQPAQGSKFGTEAYGAGQAAFSQEMGEPKSWARVKMLTLVSLAIHVISSLLIFLGLNEETLRESTIASFEAQGIAASDAAVDQAIQFGMIFGLSMGIGSIVLGVILYLVVFLGVRKGKNWGRILGTIFAAIGTAYTLFGLFGIGTTFAINPMLGVVTLVLSVAFIAVNVWWIVSAFAKPSSAYVSARSGR